MLSPLSPGRPGMPAGLPAGAPSPLSRTLNQFLKAKDAAAAFRLCRERIDEAPEDAEAHRCLGLLYAAEGNTGAALKAARRACALSPDDIRCWSDLGRTYAVLGKVEEAARCFAEAIEIDVRFADGWHNLGMACRKLGRRRAGFTALKNALLIDGTRADSYLELAILLIEAGQLDDAVEALERAAEHDPTLPLARSRLAGQLSQRGQVKRAESLFRQSLGMDSDHIEGWMGLGQTLEDLGEAEGARSAYLNVLQRRPDHATALGQYLAILPEGEPATGNGTDWLGRADEIMNAEQVPGEAKAFVGYGLLKFHDRRENVAAAAEAGRRANAARRRASGALDRDTLAGRVDGILETYTSEFFLDRRHFGLGADQPVFIVGLPRSGTTLTEQILSAHPAFHGAGELPALSRLAVSVLDETEPAWRAAAKLDQSSSRSLAMGYLEALRAGAPRHCLRISDKAPLNFFQLAVVALLFPNARVIHCHREARDNALSIWMQNFGPDQRYATDFGDIAFLRQQHDRLMAHWAEALPLAILDMPYEATVADPEAQARRLIDFLGASWDDRCLLFHQQARTVQTPSRWQVRQPVYSRSVGRWKAYAPYLPDFEAAFGPTGGRM